MCSKGRHERSCTRLCSAVLTRCSEYSARRRLTHPHLWRLHTAGPQPAVSKVAAHKRAAEQGQAATSAAPRPRVGRTSAAPRPHLGSIPPGWATRPRLKQRRARLSPPAARAAARRDGRTGGSGGRTGGGGGRRGGGGDVGCRGGWGGADAGVWALQPHPDEPPRFGARVSRRAGGRFRRGDVARAAAARALLLLLQGCSLTHLHATPRYTLSHRTPPFAGASAAAPLMIERTDGLTLASALLRLPGDRGARGGRDSALLALAPPPAGAVEAEPRLRRDRRRAEEVLGCTIPGAEATVVRDVAPNKRISPPPLPGHGARGAVSRESLVCLLVG